MTLNILDALAQSNELEANSTPPKFDDYHGKYMRPETFKIALERCGCDQETIEDCLFEFPEKWEWLLNYFEEKNGIKK